MKFIMQCDLSKRSQRIKGYKGMRFC